MEILGGSYRISLFLRRKSNLERARVSKLGGMEIVIEIRCKYLETLSVGYLVYIYECVVDIERLIEMASGLELGLSIDSPRTSLAWKFVSSSVSTNSLSPAISSRHRAVEALSLLCCLFCIMFQLQRFLLVNLVLSLLSLAVGEATQEILTQNARISNESLLWGPYRPNLYFGVRPRIPKSLMTGLLWAKVDSFQGVQNSTLIERRTLDFNGRKGCPKRRLG